MQLAKTAEMMKTTTTIPQKLSWLKMLAPSAPNIPLNFFITVLLLQQYSMFFTYYFK